MPKPIYLWEDLERLSDILSSIFLAKQNLEQARYEAQELKLHDLPSEVKIKRLMTEISGLEVSLNSLFKEGVNQKEEFAEILRKQGLED